MTALRSSNNLYRVPSCPPFWKFLAGKPLIHFFVRVVIAIDPIWKKDL